MNINKFIAGFFLVGILFVCSCSKLEWWAGKQGVLSNKNLPYVTGYIDSTSDSSITVTINVKDGGNPPVTSQGVCWSTSPNPKDTASTTSNVIYYTKPLITFDTTITQNETISNNDTIIKYDTTIKKDTSIATNFTITIPHLSPKTTYYIRGFATNNSGVGGTTASGYSSQITTTTSAVSPYYFGQILGGGMIFYIDSTGQHGLICDTANLAYSIKNYYSTTDSLGNVTVDSLFVVSDSFPWSFLNSNNIFLGNGTAVGTGSTNTLAILTTFDSLTSPNFDSLTAPYYDNIHSPLPTIAAFVCRYSHNGDTTWYLPSKDELNFMYSNLAARGYGNFSIGNYWSSSDYSFNTKIYAWAQYFGDGNQYYFNQSLPLYVRAVKKF